MRICQLLACQVRRIRLSMHDANALKRPKKGGFFDLPVFHYPSLTKLQHYHCSY